ncbi:MAG: type II toxin-antitoxin system PemK/MazF family toxin [Verrucomicrobia bacterium]|nr:type II toxin-antitoxin system PemK/MazF family toxin [Verrucomicrobiota bacterium]
MTPKVGEVYLLDLGYEGKVRPVVVMSREDSEAPRALALCVPLTTENRGSRYEVPMPRVAWLKKQGVANVQGIAAAGFHELTDRRGQFDPATVSKIKNAIRWAFEL